jgi:YegS/Rv2252/BmrU family lipid kinase
MANKLDILSRVEITRHPGHAIEIVKHHAELGGEWRVYACGGDGTLNEVVRGAAGYDNIAVTHYPCGTGNDFIKCFKDAAAFRDLERIINGHEITVDCMEMGNDRYAVNICSVGVDADVPADMPKFRWAGRFGSKMPYNLALFTTLLKGIHKPYKVTVDGESYDGEYTILTVCNGQVYGGGFHACPDADPTDGTLEFLLVKKMSRFKLAKLVGIYARGGYKQLERYIRHVRGKTMTIEAAKDINICGDGEVYRERKVTFALSEQKIRFILPEGVCLQNDVYVAGVYGNPVSN